MKTGAYKSIKRESYEHLASLGNFFFFKNFAPIIVGSGAFNLPSTVEELRKAHLASGWMRLRELGCSVVSELRVGVGSGGWRVLRRLRVLLAVLPCCHATVLPSRVNLFPWGQCEMRTNC